MALAVTRDDLSTNATALPGQNTSNKCIGQLKSYPCKSRWRLITFMKPSREIWILPKACSGQNLYFQLMYLLLEVRHDMIEKLSQAR